MKNKLRFEELSQISYENLCAKLFNFCKQTFGANVKIKTVAAFSEFDQGRGSAILWLTKHFSTFPVEMGSIDGEIEVDDLSNQILPGFPTIIIQSIPLNMPHNSSLYIEKVSHVDSDFSSSQTKKVVAHLPKIEAFDCSDEQVAYTRVKREVEVVNQYLAINHTKERGQFVYLVGISFSDKRTEHRKFPASWFVPWYLFVTNGSKNNRIYRQPELDGLLLDLSSDNPKMIDLNSIATDMIED